MSITSLRLTYCCGNDEKCAKGCYCQCHALAARVDKLYDWQRRAIQVLPLVNRRSGTDLADFVSLLFREYAEGNEHPGVTIDASARSPDADGGKP